MNWTRFQTYGMAPDKAFEVLCNQLFENWCKEQYGTTIASIRIVNGSGGDGGVESYAVLQDRTIVGLQAKWFPESMSSKQIDQIRNSINTAKRVRDQIKRYIVCVPRDLTSITARSENSEDARWDSMVERATKDYPDLAIELWNETKLVSELQKPSSTGILKFWFENAEISDKSVKYALEKAKQSWMMTKYAPELNTFGTIANRVHLTLGELSWRKEQLKAFDTIRELCEEYRVAAEAFISVCGDKSELVEFIKETEEELNKISRESQKIGSWYGEEILPSENVDDSAFYIDFDSIVDRINHSKEHLHYHFHASDVNKILRKLGKYDFGTLLSNFEWSCCQQSLLFVGAPGTGKTHGIGALSEKLLSDGIHTPLLIQARNIPASFTWKDIVSDYLGLSLTWNEDEIWQALASLANRRYFQESLLSSAIRILPKVVIFVDALDESSTQERWIERIQEAKVITSNYPQIRFCFTARPTFINIKTDCAKIERLSNTGDVPTHMLFDNYIRAYNIRTQNIGWLKYSLTTPLALKMFCELNQGQEVRLSNRTEVSMTALWRKQIERIENEYCKKVGQPVKNQYVLQAIFLLSKEYVNSVRLERSVLEDLLTNSLKMTMDSADRLIDYLESYGVLSCYCQHGTGLLPNVYFYYPGIQGYFDYASALHIMSLYEHPQDIDFNACKTVSSNTLNGLAVLSIQKYGYLLARNPTIDAVAEEWSIQELGFLALLHADYDTAAVFSDRMKEGMSENADTLIVIANQLILPLARDCEHPLGVRLLDDFLNGFEKPAQRDVLWSIPGYLRCSAGKLWYQSETFELQGENYLLDAGDTHKGCPTIYAWALSSVNNSLRKLYRNRLMEWARQAPEEFYKLFLKFSFVNDPQIRSDMFSILMCLMHDRTDQGQIKIVSDWILENVLHPERIDENRDIAIRYYSIAIIKRAIQLGLIDQDAVNTYMPPYSVSGCDIALNKEALSGTRMGGYKAIDYDLARYVLVDHIESEFYNYHHRKERQFEKLIDDIVAEQPEYAGMTVEKFIISAAYAFILQMGWNEQEFYNHAKDTSGEVIADGVDYSILRTYSPATHGSQSSVMTVCEKYVWQARNQISGFLCDRLLFGDENEPITDYGLFDDFVIPVQEASIIDPDNIPDDRPWHIPEPNNVMLEGRPTSANDVIRYASEAPTLDWEKWIHFKNMDGAYEVEGENLFALDMYSCFYGTAGVETCLFMSTVLVNESEVTDFVEAVIESGKKSNRVVNPTDWEGGIRSSCYITPKEVCWFYWKARYDSPNVYEFPQFDLTSAVDACCYNSQDYGDVYFYLPSAPVRDILEITDSDGYLFFNQEKAVIAEQSIAGEKWRTYQKYLVVDAAYLLNRMKAAEKTLVWIMSERRCNSGNTQEKYGRFGVDRMKSYIGYYHGKRFVVKEFHSEIWKSEPETKTTNV